MLKEATKFSAPFGHGFHEKAGRVNRKVRSRRIKMSGFPGPPSVLPCARRGCTRGGSPLVGGAGSMHACQRVLLARSVPPAWGEPARPGFPPEGETGKGVSKFAAAAGCFFVHRTPPFYPVVIQQKALCVLPKLRHRRFALLPFALLSGAMLRCPLESSI
jgi:hypothetical protein